MDHIPGLRDEPPQSTCAAIPPVHLPNTTQTLAPLGAEHKASKWEEGRKCRDKLTPRFQLTLHPASWNHFGSYIHLLWASVGSPVKQGHLAQGHTRSCSKAQSKRRWTGNWHLFNTFCELVLSGHMISFIPRPFLLQKNPLRFTDKDAEAQR